MKLNLELKDYDTQNKNVTSYIVVQNAIWCRRVTIKRVYGFYGVIVPTTLKRAWNL